MSCVRKDTSGAARQRFSDAIFTCANSGLSGYAARPLVYDGPQTSAVTLVEYEYDRRPLDHCHMPDVFQNSACQH